MRFLAPIAALTALAAAPIMAAQTAATPDSIAQTFIADMIAQKSSDMIMHFFGDSDLMAKKAMDMAALAKQLDHTFEAYGPVTGCDLADTVKRGTVVETRMYLCQHQDIILRWRLTFIKTSKGWSGGYLHFDEKIWLPIGSD